MRKFLMLITVLFLVFFIYSCTGSGEVSISFEENGGTEVEDLTVSTSSTSINLPEPTKEGFTFDGWYLDDALTQPFTIASLLTNTSLTLYAKWTSSVVQYTITFESNGGSAVAAITQEEGSAVTAPVNPTKSGFTFAGWFSDTALSNAYTFSNMPSSNTTLYAKWEAVAVITKTITFESNGGSAVAAITQEVGSAVIAPTAPTKVGSTFNGWFSDLSLTTAYTFTTMPASNTTLYAKWTVNTYTISFEENGGSLVLDITQEYNTSVIAPATPTKVGSTFNGWYSDISLTTAYTFTTMPASNTSLYAKWTVNTYTITYNSNGGSAVSNTVAPYLSTITSPVAPTKTGHSFDGWYSDVDLLIPYVFSTMPANDFTLYAKWNLNTYTITFEENGGSAVADITQNYLTTVTQPANPTKEGFDFVSWYTNQEFTQIYTFTTMPAENITLYAKWVYKEYTINYVDGTNVIAPTMIKAFDPIVLIADPVRPGYTFDGWYNEALLINSFQLTLMPEENITIYAKWSPVIFTISYESNGGSVVTEKLIPYLGTITEHEIPTKEGFVFVGWYIDITLINQFTETIMPLGNITLYAKWIVDDGYDAISTILSQNPSAVKVKGVVYYKFPNPMNPGFYLYDGTGFIFVLAPSTGLAVGDGIELEGDFGYFEYVPQITNVTNIAVNNSFNTLPNDVAMGFDELILSTPENKYLFGQPIVISGVVGKFNGYFFLVQAGSDSKIAINYKSIDPMNNPFDSKVGSMITMHAIIHGVDPMMEIWHIIYNPTTPIEEIILTDQQKVDELILFGISQLDGKEFYSSQYLDLPEVEPVYGATLHFETIGENASYFNVTTGLFQETDVQKSITIRITVTLGSVIETVDVTIILLPTEILTISEFMLLNEMDYAMVSGIVIFSFNEASLIIIADETGSILAVQSDMPAQYGDLIIVHGYHVVMEGLVLMYGSEDTVLEVLDEGLANPITPVELTVAQFNALDVFNSLYWAKYLKVSGVLVIDEMTHSIYLEDGLSSMPILVFNQDIYQLLVQFNGFNVTLGGFSLPNFDDEPFLMFIFTGQSEDLNLDYSDQELLDMLALMLQGYLESLTFIPGQIADLPTEHPLFDLTVSYAVQLEDADYINMLTMQISSDIDTELWISIMATLTIGGLTKDVDIELFVKPLEILSIAEFLLLTDEDMHYVTGVILMIVEEQSMMMIADSTGVILAVSTNPMIKVGDLVLLVGAKMITPEGMIILANNPANTVESILLSNQDNPLTPTPISVEAFTQLDPNNLDNYLTYYQVEGLLIKHLSEDIFIISDGMNQLPVFAPTPFSTLALIPYEGQEVKISGFSLAISDGEGMMVLIFIGNPQDITQRYTDAELALHIASSLSDEYATKVLRPGATHKLPNGYPPYSASIGYEVIGENQALYSLVTGLISNTITTETYIGIKATITVGDSVEIVEFDLWIVPIVTQTVADFNAGAFDELYTIRAIVVMEQMMDGPMIIADATGHMFVVKNLNLKVGDEVIIQGYKRDHEGIPLIWDEETTIVLEILSTGIENPMSVQMHTIASYNDIDMTDINNWGLYVEITGYMSMFEDSFFPVLTELIDGGEFAVIAPMYLIYDGPSLLMIDHPMEPLYIYIGYQVRVRGFLLPNFGEEDPLAPDRMLIINSEEEIVLNYQTDQEKIDALIEFGEYMLNNNIFRPGDSINLPEYVETLGIHISWEFVGTNGYALDLDQMIFLDVMDTEYIDFEATMTIGELTVTHLFVLTLQPYAVITIEDFYGLQDGEYGKLHVIVIEVVDYYGVIFSELGNSLYLFGYGYEDLSVGDEVMLFGAKELDQGFVSINSYNDKAYYQVIDTGIVQPLIERETPLEELANASTDSMNLLYYHKVAGHLVYNENNYSYYLTDGLQSILLNIVDSNVYTLLSGYVGEDVELKLFNFQYHHTGWGAYWNGLVLDGENIITTVTLTDEQLLDIMMKYMKNEMNRTFKDDMTYVFSSTHPIYGGTYTFAIDMLHASLATVDGHTITFASTVEETYATVHITATINEMEYISLYDLIIIPYDDPMSTFSTGSKGIVPTFDDTVLENTFGGLIITKVERQSDWFGGSDMIVDLSFPYPFEIGASYYTLEYYDFDNLLWKEFIHDGYPLSTTWNNFSLIMNGSMTLRLVTDTGLVSNTVNFQATYVDTYFAGWYLSYGMDITGIMSPFVGFGLELDDISVYDLDGILIETGLSVQWYRVNPFTFEEFAITGATQMKYITKMDDLGYYMMVKVYGDEVNVGGMMKIYNMETVKLFNQGYVTNDTTMGFSIGFDYIIDIDDLNDLIIYDQYGQLVPIHTISATSNPAVFDIELNLIGVYEIYIHLDQPTYVIGEYIYYYNQIGIHVNLIF